MSLSISSTTVNKLEHEIPEIRFRALKHIEARLSRVLLQDNEIMFNPGSILKKLIRWFGYKPLCEEESVLNLILMILKSKYIDEAIDYLQINRLKSEIGKIYEILKHEKHKKIVIEIKNILENYQANNIENKNVCDSRNSDNLSVIEIPLEQSNAGTSCIDEDDSIYDYEESWSSPSSPDYNSLNMLCDTLRFATEKNALNHAFKYLDIAINDYPPEYFLQSPHIFKALLKLFQNNQQIEDDLLQNFIRLTRSLINRIKMRKLSSYFEVAQNNVITNKLLAKVKYQKSLKSFKQITITCFCEKLFNLCVQHIKQLSENQNKTQMYFVIRLLFDLIDLIDEDLNSKISYKSLLIDIGYITKYYRQSQCISHSWRIYYILFIFLITKILAIAKKFDIKFDISHKNDHIRQLINNKKSYKFNRLVESNVTGIKTIWCEELQMALLDFPLRETYPNVYENVKVALNFISYNISDDINIILNNDHLLTLAAKFLRDSGELSDKDLIFQGYEAMETLSIHLSLDFVKNLVESINRCKKYFDKNAELKKKSENIILRLFAHENLDIKRYVYNNFSNKMKQYFADLLGGKENTGKFRKTKITLDVILTSDLITEIICFGYSNDNIHIKKDAEIILNILLKSRFVIGGHWSNILEILIPSLPLLQCITTKETSLGTLLLELYDPDNNAHVPHLELIQGNMRYLFNADPSIRSEALSRLVYILTQYENCDSYIPNIYEIKNTLSDHICILDTPRDSEKIISSNLYEKSMVFSLLKLLQSTEIDPQVRKTTLMQLNVICQDFEMNNLVHDEKGWYMAIEAIESTLRKEPIINYPDTVIPAIGILTKISLCNPVFRRELAKEENIYNLLLRSLFLFHHDLVAKQDCSLLIFLFTFNTFIIGSRNITIPKEFSQLKLPIKCDFHWFTSPYNHKSLLEKVYQKITNNNDKSERSMSSSLSLNTLSNNGSSNNELNNLKDEIDSNIQKNILQYIRIHFTTIWFDGFEFILKAIKNIANGNTIENMKLDYTLLPGHLYSTNDNNIVEIKNSMEFNKNLCLLPEDIKLIKYTSFSHNINNCLKKIWNATDYNDVITNLNLLKTIFLLSSTCKKEQILIKPQQFIDCFNKYYTKIPNYKSQIDVLLYEKIINFLAYCFKEGIDDTTTILQWILEDLQQKHSIPLIILQNLNYSRQIYQNICHLLGIIVQISNDYLKKDEKSIKKLIIYSESTAYSKTIESKRSTIGDNKTVIVNKNLFKYIFEFLMPITEKCFEKRALTRLYALLNVISILSSIEELNIDLNSVQDISIKMLNYAISLKSFTQAGSSFIKKCLLITTNLLNHTNELVLENKHLRFLSGLCGHTNFEIRYLSWCILGRISKYLNGASAIVKELSFLPGGFHACCISTFLDKSECSCVRTAAGNCFSILLTHKIKLSNDSYNLEVSVAPFCLEYDDLDDEEIIDGSYLIKEIFRKHRFFAAIYSSLEHIYIPDIINNLQLPEITTCEIIITYCSILMNYIDLRPSVVDELLEQPFLTQLLSLIKLVPEWLTLSSLKMAGFICNLFLRIFKRNSSSLERNITHDYELIINLTKLLNLKFIEDSPIKISILPIIEMIRILSNETILFQAFCDVISTEETYKRIINLISSGIMADNEKEFQSTCLKFLLSLLIKSQTDIFKFQTFSNIIDSETIIQEYSLSTISNLEHNKNDDKNSEYYEISGSEILFKYLFNKLEKCFSYDNVIKIKTKDENKILITHCIGLLLKTTENSRKYANKINFIGYLIKKFECIHENIGLSCTDFIRKYGDGKKSIVIRELSILYEIILNWYSSDVFVNEEFCVKLCKITSQLWPWILSVNDLKIIVLKCLAFLSQDSLIVCKRFSTSYSTQSSILQLVHNVVVTDTKKLRVSNVDFSILEFGIKILEHCCSCIEARLLMIKINVLDIFDIFHPSTTKLQKQWNYVTLLWLKFWNIFSRYSEGNNVRHLILMSNLIIKADKLIKLECLKIIRNMSFSTGNRAALLSSRDFLYVVKNVLTEGNCEEQLIIAVTIWKLIENNYRAKHLIKNTGIPSHLLEIMNQNSTAIITNIHFEPLARVIKTVLEILNV